MGDWLDIVAIAMQVFPWVLQSELAHWLCHQLPWFRVVRRDGRVAGFIHVQPRAPERMLWLNMLAVGAWAQGRGVGRELLLGYEALAGRWGLEQLGLQCDSVNHAALCMYEQHGYQLVSTNHGEVSRLMYYGYRKPTPQPCTRGRPQHLDGRIKGRCYGLCYRLWVRPGWLRRARALFSS
ncbi:MAG: hypothetical protein RJA44_974 [Pseudomonadota bacterium]